MDDELEETFQEIMYTYTKNWTLERKRNLEFSGMAVDSEIKRFKAPLDNFWIVMKGEGVNQINVDVSKASKNAPVKA